MKEKNQEEQGVGFFLVKLVWSRFLHVTNHQKEKNEKFRARFERNKDNYMY